jgi:hypothetical protein
MVYEQIQVQKKINLFALSKATKKKPLDILEDRGLLGLAAEIAQNMNFRPGDIPHPAQTGTQRDIVDPETGEILN